MKPPKVVWVTVDSAGETTAIHDTEAIAVVWARDVETVHKYILAPAPKRPRKKGRRR